MRVLLLISTVLGWLPVGIDGDIGQRPSLSATLQYIAIQGKHSSEDGFATELGQGSRELLCHVLRIFLVRFK